MCLMEFNIQAHRLFHSSETEVLLVCTMILIKIILIPLRTHFLTQRQITAHKELLQNTENCLSFRQGIQEYHSKIFLTFEEK